MMRRTFALVTTVAFLVSLLVGVAGPYLPKAHALPQATLGHVSPYPQNSYPDPPQGEHVHFIRKQGQVTGEQLNAELKVYYADESTWGSRYLQIVPGANPGVSNVCDAISKGMTTNLYQFLSVTLTSLDKNGSPESGKQVTYNIPASNVCKENLSRQNKPTGAPVSEQHNNVYYANYPLPPKPSEVDTITGRYVIAVDISYADNVPVDSSQGIRFRVKEPDGSDALIGQLGGGGRNFSILGDWTYANPSYNWSGATRIAIPFGQCTDNNGLPTDDQTGGKIIIYDADNTGPNFQSPFGNYTVTLRVKDNDYDPITHPTPGVDSSGYVKLKDPASTGTSQDQSLSSDALTFTPASGTANEAGKSTVVMRHFVANDHYQLEVSGIAIRNTIAIGIPGDAVYGTLRCQNIKVPSLDCSVQLKGGVDGYFQPGDDVKATITARAHNFAGSPTKWTVGTTSPTTTQQTAGNNGTSSYTSSPPLDLGTFGVGNHPVAAYAQAQASDGTVVKQNCNGDTNFDVSLLPYLSVYGGDASAGTYPQRTDTVANPTSITSEAQQDLNAGFESWNYDGSGGYAGAGDQIAISALGENSYHFVSNLSSSSTTPSLLVFANAYVSPSDPTNYGGSFGATYGMPPGYDYVGDLTNATRLAAGSQYNGNSNVTGQTTIFVPGDVYIAGNVIYTLYGTVSQLPSFKLVAVGGDIYIKNDVTDLHGLYVAEPDNTGKGGTIYTCATGVGSAISLSEQTDPNYYADLFGTCNHPLRIWGSFVAKHIDFGRTSGTLNQSSTDSALNSNAAETFIYSPEMWLPNGTASGSNVPANFMGLPPVL